MPPPCWHKHSVKDANYCRNSLGPCRIWTFSHDSQSEHWTTWWYYEEQKSDLKQELVRKYDILAKTSMDGFWVLDATGQIVFASQTISRMYGYNSEEMTGKHLRDFDAIEDEIFRIEIWSRPLGCDAYLLHEYPPPDRQQILLIANLAHAFSNPLLMWPASYITVFEF